jgi:NADPH:quinone reductase-like Zn-dependent oxidoreductase
MQGSSVRANRIVMGSSGPPSVLRYEQYDIATPGPHEVLIRQTAIGLNYIDIQHRTGRYLLGACRQHQRCKIASAGNGGLNTPRIYGQPSRKRLEGSTF